MSIEWHSASKDCTGKFERFTVSKGCTVETLHIRTVAHTHEKEAFMAVRSGDHHFKTAQGATLDLVGHLRRMADAIEDGAGLLDREVKL